MCNHAVPVHKTSQHSHIYTHTHIRTLEAEATLEGACSSEAITVHISSVVKI